jgi:quercetin dioxygenase-like cupin family protein
LVVSPSTTAERAEIVAVVSGAVGAVQRDDQKHRHGTQEVDPPRAVEACPTGAAAEVQDLAEARMSTGAAFDQVDHDQIALYRYRLAPGSSSGWHHLPDPGFIVQAAGSTTVRTGCEETATYEPGGAYVHDARDRPQLITNPGTEAAEYYVVAFQVPSTHPADVPRMTPAVPPSNCPESALTAG